MENKETQIPGEGEVFTHLQKSFSTVLDANKHLDDKAGRSLTALSFVVASGTTLFSRTYQLKFPVSSPYWAYCVFIVLSMVAAILYIWSIGPFIEREHGSKSVNTNEEKSYLFYDDIAKNDDWEAMWDNFSLPELRKNYIKETKLIAKATQRKYVRNRYANIFFGVSSLILVIYVVLLSVGGE